MLYFLFLLAGMILFTIVDIMRWNKATPHITQVETFRQYFALNWLGVIASMIIGVVILGLGLNGEFAIFELLNLSPVLSLTGAFLIGTGSSALLKQLMGTVPEMGTTGDKIDTPKKVIDK